MRQTIINNLNKLFSGDIDTIKISYNTPRLHDVMKFTLHGHEIHEENDLITVYDDKDKQSIPKTVNIDPLMVKEVTYEDGKADGLGIYGKKVVISMSDGGEILMETVAMG